MMHRAIDGGWGVEILDVDAAQPVSSEVAAELRTLFDKYQLLVFRNQKLEATDQIRLLSVLGPVSDESEDGTYHSFVSNALANGRFGDLALTWHADFGYIDYQPPALSLYAVDVGAAAAPTQFVNCAVAARRLPKDLSARIASMTLLQRAAFAGGDATAKGLGVPKLPTTTARTQSTQPVLRKHPRTGDPLLNVSQKHTQHIDGLEKKQSDDLIRELSGRLYADENVYTHKWSNGDIVIWDNVACQHGRADLGGSGGPEYRRTLRRVIVSEFTGKELLSDDTLGVIAANG